MRFTQPGGDWTQVGGDCTARIQNEIGGHGAHTILPQSHPPSPQARSVAQDPIQNRTTITLRTKIREVPGTSIDVLAVFFPGGNFLLVGAATGRMEWRPPVESELKFGKGE